MDILEDKKEDKKIKLDQFLKLVGVASTGGQAKFMILDGLVKVNGVMETRRGRKLSPTDTVTIETQNFIVEDFLEV